MVSRQPFQLADHREPAVVTNPGTQSGVQDHYVEVTLVSG